MKRRLSNDRLRRTFAFSLIEVMLAVAVVTMMLLVLTQVMRSGTTIASAGNKHIDTDTEARAVLDRMAVDVAKMLKRTDVDYYVKGSGGYTGHGNGHGKGKKVSSGQQGSDQYAFFSQVMGYYPTSAGSAI